MNMRSIYRKVAKKHGVSVKEVKDEMEKALNSAYTNPSNDDIIIDCQKQVPSKGEIPTPEEFIRYVANKVEK